MKHRRLICHVLALCLTGCLVWSCAGTTKHQLLSFFFDGVPSPVAEPAEGEQHTEEPKSEVIATAEPRRTRARLFAHEPYQTNRCGACHNPQDGGLLRPPERGLCQGCHQGVPGDARYVHGPVNVKACLFCHHPHASPYEGVLAAAPTDLCLRCHEPDDLTAGPHHEEVEDRSCADCHDAHGGDNRFFLRPGES